VSGPLNGFTVIELAGIGPGPFATMLLADMGARVIRIDQAGPSSADYTPNPVLERGRESIALNLKTDDGRQAALRLIERADVLVESYRPGVAERLGVGPAPCLARNPRLVYGRMTGWGQDGPWARAAGHDINYISLTGALHAIGTRADGPIPPLNLVGDFGGGALYLAFGIACALVEVARSSHGQVVDANVLEGTSSLLALTRGLAAAGRWTDERESNLLDGAAPFYRTYRCADGEFIAVGCIEERFFVELLDVLDLDPELVSVHKDRSRWAEAREILAARIAEQPRDIWVERSGDRDTCLSPVLSLAEAVHHPQAQARNILAPLPDDPDTVQPAPAPRFSRTHAVVPAAAPVKGQHTRSVLAEIGYSATQINTLIRDGAATP